MRTDGDRIVREKALTLSHGLAAHWERTLGDDLLGCYLLGSLAHGGFSRRYSDVDIGLISQVPLRDKDLEAMRSTALSLSPDLATRVSLFWTDRTFAIGRFPLLDRLDYLDHSIALFEREIVRPDRPTLENVRSFLSGGPFENWSRNAKKFVARETLKPEDHKPFLRAFLYAPRFFYSWTTGRMGSNDDAMELLRAEVPDGLNVELLERAFQIRLDAADPDPLFKDRKSLLGLVESCGRMFGNNP